MSDRLIGWRHHQYRIIAIFKCVQSRQGQRRGGIPTYGFEQQAARLQAGFTQLVENQKPVLFIADDRRAMQNDVFVGQRSQPACRLLEQTGVA